jgi:hypothetical protein
VDAVVVEMGAECVDGLEHPHHTTITGHEQEPADAVLGGSVRVGAAVMYAG